MTWLLAGNLIDGEIIRIFTDNSSDTRVYDWDTIWGITFIFSIFLLVTFIILFKKEKTETIQ